MTEKDKRCETCVHFMKPFRVDAKKKFVGACELTLMADPDGEAWFTALDSDEVCERWERP